MNIRKYVIVDSSQVVNFDFTKLVDIDESYIRTNLAGNKALARFEGDTPSFLIGEPQYNHEEIKSILSGPDWTDPEAIL